MKTKLNQPTSESSLQSQFVHLLRTAVAGKTRITMATILSFVMISGVALAQLTGSCDNAYVTVVHPDGTRDCFLLEQPPTECDRGAVLQQAKADASSGDTIIVGPGTAKTNKLLKNGVNWHFMAGAVILGDCCSEPQGCGHSSAIFDDNDGTNDPVGCIISGEGKFQTGQLDYSPVVSLQKEGTNVSVAAESMEGAYPPPVATVIYNRRATLHVKANRIISPGSNAAIWWWSGPMHVEAHEIVNLGDVILSTAPNGEVGEGYLWVQANLIKSTAPASANIAIHTNDSDSGTRQWIQALQIEGFVAIKKTGTGLTYVRTEKVFGQIAHQGGTLYVDSEKISPSRGLSGQYLNDNLIKLSGTNSWINILQIDDADLEDSTHSPAAVAVSAGTHFLRGSSLARVTAGDGISVTGGSLTVNGLAISTLNGSNDLVQTDGALKVLGCKYSLRKTGGTGTITQGDPQVGFLGMAAFNAVSEKPSAGEFNGIVKTVESVGPGVYRVDFAVSQPDTNYMVSIAAESSSDKGTVCFWSEKSNYGFTVKLVDLSTNDFADQDGVRVTVSRIP